MADTRDCHLVKPIAPNKGEVDARPLESVKAALSLFGESVSEPTDGRKLKTSCGEKNVAKDRDLFLLQNGFTMSVDKRINSEDTELQHQLELEKTKMVFEAFNSKLEEGKSSKEKARKVSVLVKKLEATNPHFIEAYNMVLKEELSAAREQYMMATAELETMREKLRKTKANVSAYKKAEALALKQVEEAKMAAENSNMKLEELVKEIEAINESLALLQLAWTEAEKENAVLMAAKEVETQEVAEMASQNRKQLEALEREVVAAKDLETKLTATTSIIETLQQELHLAKDSESILDKVVADANQSLNELNLKIKQAESDAATSLKSISAELEEAKENLKRTTEECNSLRNSAEFLREELEQLRKEIYESRERETEAEVSIAMLNAELHQSRSKLAAAAAAEAKAEAGALELSVALKQLATEAKGAKEEAKVMKEEARQANLEVEHTKANLTTAEAKLQDALKEAVEVKEAAEVAKEESIKAKLEAEKMMDDMTHLELKLQNAIKMAEEMTEECQAMKQEAGKAKLEAEQAKAEMTSLELKLKDALMEGEATKEEVQAMKVEAGKANSEAEKAKADKATIEAQLQDALKVAETEKQAAHAMQEEARKAKLETEQSKADVDTVEASLQDAIKEAETARIAEAAARSELRSLYAEKDEGMNAHKFFTGITISQDEYESLMKKVKEADIKAAEIKEGGKEGDEELLRKLETANREIQELKMASGRAALRADKEAIGSRAVENELRKWRKRAYAAGYEAPKEQPVQNSVIIPKPSVPVINPMNAEPLSKFLNIKIQSTEELQSSNSNTNTNANAKANDVTERKRNRIIANFIKKKT